MLYEIVLLVPGIQNDEGTYWYCDVLRGIQPVNNQGLLTDMQ